MASRLIANIMSFIITIAMASQHVAIIILILHLSVRPCVRESGRSREAIRPVLKNFPFSGSLELDATQESPLTQPAMAPALD